MRWLKILIIILIIYGIFGHQQFYASSAKQTNQNLNEIRRVQSFLQKYNSPLKENAKDFVEAGEKYHLDYRLLPTVACVESSCGKNYKLNPFGWASDTVSYGSTTENIFAIASRINSLSYYKTYKKTKDLRDFAKAYNGKFAEDYYRKLIYFYNQL